MKKFKFRLQTVLEHRERIRDERKGDLLKANQALNEAQSELERLRNLEIENMLSIQEVTTSAVVVLNSQIAEGLRQRIANQRAVIVIREESLAKAMEAYKEASIELKAVSTLRERKLQEFNKRVLDLEAAVLDELAIQRDGKQFKQM